MTNDFKNKQSSGARPPRSEGSAVSTVSRILYSGRQFGVGQHKKGISGIKRKYSGRGSAQAHTACLPSPASSSRRASAEPTASPSGDLWQRIR